MIATRLLCACALSFAAFVAGAQDKAPPASIVGTWKVVTYEDRTEGQPAKRKKCPFEIKGDRLTLRNGRWTASSGPACAFSSA